MTKTIANLDLCAQLHVVGSNDSFLATSEAYRYLPSIMKIGKNKKLFWNTVLLSREGFEFYEKKINCIKCQENKQTKNISSNNGVWLIKRRVHAKYV